MSESNVRIEIGGQINGAVPEVTLCSGCSDMIDDPEKACSIAGGRILLCDDCVVEMMGNVVNALKRAEALKRGVGYVTGAAREARSGRRGAGMA